MNSEELREQLRNFRSRAEAIAAAISAGDAAVEAALALLNDRHDGVRWSAISILSEIGDERAVPPLIALLKREKNTVAAANALKALTGQDLGDDVNAWLEWSSGGATASGPEGATDAALIDAAIKDLPVTLSGGEQGLYVAEVSMADGRSQKVWIDFRASDSGGDPTVQLSTTCGPASAEHYEWALKTNMQLSYGAIGIADTAGTVSFAMVDSYSRATVDAQDLAKSLIALATHADSIEASLTKQDRH